MALPAGYDGRTARPLVFDFHGYGGTKEKQEANTSMAATGTTRGFVVVTPDALGSPRRWNWTGAPGRADDFGFVHALLDHLEKTLCVDADRVYVAGHSNGSAFAAFLVCRPPYDFAAVAMVSGTTPTTCPDGVIPAAIAIHGKADPHVLYDGGGPRHLPAASDVIARYAQQYGCSGSPTHDEPAAGVERLDYRDCPEGTEVVLDAIDGGVHAWPGGPQAAGQPGSSTADRRFPATEEILDFFAHHRRIPR
jgi:polyhydroxybutyrate depolymerase